MALLETNFAAGQLKGSVGEMVIVRYKRGVKIVRRKPVRTSERTAFGKTAFPNPIRGGPG